MADPAAQPRRQPSPWAVTFTDSPQRAGLREPIVYGGVDRKRFIIETNGAGVALVDYDRDGWLDALVLERHAPEGRHARQTRRIRAGAAPTNRLYRNRRDGTFEDVTDAAGLRRTGWASSVCAGDYDNDGWTDLFVTYYGQQRALPESRADASRTSPAAPGCRRPASRWGSGCTFVDYDRDGRLDLFVANYLRFDLATARGAGRRRRTACGRACRSTAARRGCRPTPTCSIAIAATARSPTCRSASGIATRHRALLDDGASTADLDGDGWPDIYVAADSTAAILYRNNRDGTFTDVAVESGAAYSENGNAQAGMGVAVGDYNRDGRLDLLKTHFADDIPSLYRNLGKGLFEDVAVAAGLAVENRLRAVGRRACPTSTTTACRISSTSPATSIRRSSGCCRSIRTAVRGSCSATPAGRAFEHVTARERRRRRRRTRAAARRSATSTTTATSTCSS